MPLNGLERFNLILEALPDSGASPIIRLRRFLKSALRSYGLRCTRAEALPAEGEVATADPVPTEGDGATA